MESYSTLTTLKFALKIFSLHNITYMNKFTVDRWPFFRVILFLSVNGFLFACTLFTHFSEDFFLHSSLSVIVADGVISLLSYFQYIADLYFVYIYSIRMCVYYNIYDQMDKAINMKYCKEIKQKVFTSMALFLSLWLAATLGEYTAWALQFGWVWSLFYAAHYFMALVRFLTVLDINSQTLHIKYRLISIADKIEELASFSNDGARCIITAENKRGRIQNRAKIVPFIYRCSIDVTKLNSYYLLLLDQTRFLNSFFGFRMLLHCLFTLLEVITCINIVARFISGTSVLFCVFLPVAANLMRCFNYVVALCSMIYHCDTCCQQCNVIVDVIDKLVVNKSVSSDVVSSLTALRVLVSSRPLRFHAAGFFKLDSALLLSVVSVVITYAVVLVQNTQ